MGRFDCYKGLVLPELTLKELKLITKKNNVTCNPIETQEINLEAG